MSPTRPVECRSCGLISPPSALTCDCGAALGATAPAAEAAGAQVDLPPSREGEWSRPCGVLFVGLAGMFLSIAALEPGSVPMKTAFYLGAGIPVVGAGMLSEVVAPGAEAKVTPRSPGPAPVEGSSGRALSYRSHQRASSSSMAAKGSARMRAGASSPKVATRP